MTYKIGDKVKIIIQKNTDHYEGTCGLVGTIQSYYDKTESYGIELKDKCNPQSRYGYFYFRSEEFEPYTLSEMITWFKIRNEKLSCVIHTATQEEANLLSHSLDNDFTIKPSECWTGFETCYVIKNGRLNAWTVNRTYGLPVYEFKDIQEASTKAFRETGKKNISNINLEEVMNENNKPIFKISFNNGQREEKHKVTKYDRTKTVTETIKTIATHVCTDLGAACVTCDANDFNEYTGALVAAAKITASKSEEANLLYRTAMDMWNTPMGTTLLKALANRASNGHFDSSFKKWKKARISWKKQEDIKSRTCIVCGKVCDTIEEKINHEKWHEECKVRRQERKEAKRRIMAAEREGRITEYISEIIEKRKNDNEVDVNE